MPDLKISQLPSQTAISTDVVPVVSSGTTVQVTAASLVNSSQPKKHASTHAFGGTDAIDITASQVSGLSTVASSGLASDLSGTVLDTSLSANVVLTGDARLSNSRVPTSHAASHAAAGSDPISISVGQVSGLAAVASSGKYADLSGSPAAYSLPIAAAGSLGGVRVGTGLTVDAATGTLAASLDQTAADGRYLQLSGGTVTGSTTVSANVYVTTGKLGVGTSSPANAVTVVSTTGPVVSLTNTNVDASGSSLRLEKSPSDNSVAAGDSLGQIEFAALDNANTLRTSAIVSATVSARNASTVDGYVSISTVSSATSAERLRIADKLTVTSVSSSNALGFVYATGADPVFVGSLAAGAGLQVTNNAGTALLKSTTTGLTLPSFTPANFTATGEAQTIGVDANFLYAATASNVWRRVPLKAQASTAVLTPVSGNVNNLALTRYDVWRVSSVTACSITGVTDADFVDDGMAKLLINTGSTVITLAHASASSTAANTFQCKGNVNISIDILGGSAVLVYDTVISRWRVL